MGKKAPTPPAAPDPAIAIKAQADANRYDSYTPFGNTKWSQEGDRWRQDYNFSPEAQKLFDNSLGILDRGYGGGGGSGGGYGGGYDSASTGDSTFNSGMFRNGAVNPPENPDAPYDPSNPQNVDYQGLYDDYGNAVNDRSSYLINRGFEKPLEQFQSEMANRGVPEGSDAYNDLYRARIGDPMSQAYDQAAFKSIATGEAMRVQDYNMMSNLWGRGQVAPAMPLDVQGPYNTQQNALQNNYAQEMQRQNAQFAAVASAGKAAGGKK